MDERVFRKGCRYAAFFIQGMNMKISVNGEVEQTEPQSLESYLSTSHYWVAELPLSEMAILSQNRSFLMSY